MSDEINSFLLLVMSRDVLLSRSLSECSAICESWSELRAPASIAISESRALIISLSRSSLTQVDESIEYR